MPRKKRLPRPRRGLHGLPLLNVAVTLGVGPDFGAHDPAYCGPDEEAEARRLARLWREHRDRILEELPPDPERHWAMTVLDRGEEPPWRPDPRFPDEDPRQVEYQEHQQRLAEVARQAYLEKKDR